MTPSTSVFSGTMVAPPAVVDHLYGNKSFICLLDFGASRRMTGRRAFLSNIHVILPCFIGLPNGVHIVYNSEGTVKLGPKLVIHNVLYVPNLKCNLISIS